MEDLTFDIFVKNFLFKIQMEYIYLMRYMFIQFFLIVYLLNFFLSFDEFRSDYLKKINIAKKLIA
jgi:hypothetical protein